MKATKLIWRGAWLVAISVLVLGGCANRHGTSAGPVNDDVPVQIPTLSPANIAEADKIVSELSSTFPDLDKTLRDLLIRLPHEQQGPWHSAKDYRLIGVAREVTLPAPLTLGRVSLPDVQWNEASDDYTPFTFHYDSIVELRKVSLLIDLKLNRVVAIQPVEAEEITPSDKTDFP